MEILFPFQIQFIQWLQGLGGWLQTPFQAFTFLGSEQFYILIAPALYWCLNMEAGLRLGVFLVATNSVNTYFKYLFQAPRPYWFTTQVRAIIPESSFGLPSGHAQNAVMVFGSLTRTYRQRWIWGLVAGIAFLVGLSRIYLAVHFPSDVLAGWIIGSLLLWTSFKAEPNVRAWLNKQTQLTQYLSIFGISIGSILVGIIIRWIFSAWVLPPEWAANAAAAFPNEPPLDPFNLSGIISNAGVFFGLTSGVIFLGNRGGWCTQGSLFQKAARYILGLVGLLAVYIGLDLLFPAGGNLLASIFRYIRYSITGIWISALAPILFQKLGLAK